MHSSKMCTVRCSGRRRGGCLPGGVCQGVLPRGCLPREGVVPASGVSAKGIVCLSVGWDTHTPLDRMTDACENITFPQLRCGR